MHIEVQVALNFVISYLYNKLPRRRVNIFGEELEKALKDKFQGHWYPEKPFKVSEETFCRIFTHYFDLLLDFKRNKLPFHVRRHRSSAAERVKIL